MTTKGNLKTTLIAVKQAKIKSKSVSTPLLNPICKHLSVLGFAHDPNVAGPVGVAIKPNAEGISPLVAPIEILGARNPVKLEQWLLQNGLAELLDEVKLNEVGPILRQMAAGKKQIIMSTRGFHKFSIDNQDWAGYVWQGKFHPFGKDASNQILLVDEAAAVSATVGDPKKWNRAFRRYLKNNPRILVAVCFSLAAALFSAFGLNAFVIMLIGETSQGKSTIQRLCATLIGTTDIVIHWDGTRIGLHDWLSELGDRPSFIDDMREADDPTDVLKIIMGNGNKSARIVAKRASGKKQPAQLKTHLIISSEENIADIAARSNVPVNAGIKARSCEIFLGAHGMFDDLCGHADGRELSKTLDDSSKTLNGAIWEQWIETLSNNWSKVVGWHGRNMPNIRRKILEAAGNPVCDDVTARMLDSLTFSAFSGCVASQLGILEIERNTIIDAFGLVLNEHVERQLASASPVEHRGIDEIRGFLQLHAKDFSPLSSFNSPNGRGNVAGYNMTSKSHGQLFLFPVAAFNDRFVKNSSIEIFRHLREAGFLVSQKNRHNRLLVRVPVPKGEKPCRTDFVAFKADIMFVKE